jgi:redox-sensitive bicupin YhaK (pirin superfamily)
MTAKWPIATPPVPGGEIGPGDVQWMTAASGILHEEFHSEAFTRRGGKLEMVQLWVNLPASDKMATPGYQNIGNADIPVVPWPMAPAPSA